MHGMSPRRPTGDRARREQLLRAVPNWDDVRIFLAIHHAGSLSAAASPLEMTQPTCGRRLAAFETAVGARLFDRTPEGLRLTAEGAALVEAAEAMEEGARAPSSIASAATTSAAPSAVRRSPSGVLSNSRAPTAVSNAASRSTNVGCVITSGLAAAERLPAW